MMKLYLLLFTGFLAFSLPAQYAIVPSQAVAGVYGFNEMSQTSVINSSGGTVSGCYIVIEASAQSGEKLFALKTPLFDLQAGANQLSYQSIVLASVEYGSSTFSYLQQAGKLPAGSYRCCYSLYKVGNPSSLTSECASIITQQEGAIVLISPYNGQGINTLYPSFAWMYTDIPRDNPITYSIKITELKPGQTYTDAMAFNAPLVFLQNLSETFFNYPPDALALDEAKKYVWQVEVSVGGRKKYLSEIWMFRFKKDKEKKEEVKKPEKPVQYAYLSQILDATTYNFSDKLNFRYNNECKDSILSYFVQKAGSERSIAFTEAPVTVADGINYYSFKIPENVTKGTKQGDVYVLSVTNSRKEVWKLKFVIVKDTEKKGRK